MDLHLGPVRVEMLNTFTTVVHHQPEQHFDQRENVPINGHLLKQKARIASIELFILISYSFVAVSN